MSAQVASAIEDLIEDPTEGNSVNLIVEISDDGATESISEIGGSIEEELPYDCLAVSIEETEIEELCNISTVVSIELEKEYKTKSNAEYTLPVAFETIEDMHHQMGENYSKICNSVGLKNADEESKVAVIDSAYSPSSRVQEEYNVQRTVDFVSKPDVADTTGHGKGVTSILFGHGNNMAMYLYRVVQDSGVILQRDLLKALHTATFDDNVDVINLSLGFDHSNNGVSCDMPNEPCKVRDATKQAIEEGISVVAASGNADPFDDSHEDDKTTCCPALLDEAISVGGFAPLCSYKPSGPDNNRGIQQPFNKYPPLAGWLDKQGEESHGLPLCTGLGCIPTEDGCEENRILSAWEGNVDDIDGIDVMAPTAYPIMNTNHEPDITRGTSYAAPFVTAAVSTIVTILKQDEEAIIPEEIHSAIVDTAIPLDEGDGSYISVEDAVKRIVSRKNISGGFHRPSMQGFNEMRT